MRSHRSTDAELVLLAGSAHPMLADSIGQALGMPLGRARTERFPDGEIHVDVESKAVEGRDVFIVQPTSAPVSEHLLELLFLADACRRAGAATISAVVSYFGYARQDRRKQSGEAIGVRVVTELLATARLHRIVSVDLHSDVAEACLDVPMETASAVPLLAQTLAQRVRDAVIVAPDLGAVKLAREYARLLALPMAVVHKVRTSATDVAIERVAGEVRGRRPVIVDDMISTGGTIVAAARAVQEQGGNGEIVVAATHGVLVPGALDRMRASGVRELVVTDTIAPSDLEPWATVVSVAPMLADVVLHVSRMR